jgi:beta-glucosidase-like glycosyl hydrolase
MSCYNAIDGEVVLSSKYYLTDILRGKWGLKGYVRADWGSVVRLVNRHFTAATDEDAICDFIDSLPAEKQKATLFHLLANWDRIRQELTCPSQKNRG